MHAAQALDMLQVFVRLEAIPLTHQAHPTSVMTALGMTEMAGVHTVSSSAIWASRGELGLLPSASGLGSCAFSSFTSAGMVRVRLRQAAMLNFRTTLGHLASVVGGHLLM